MGGETRTGERPPPGPRPHVGQGPGSADDRAREHLAIRRDSAADARQGDRRDRGCERPDPGGTPPLRAPPCTREDLLSPRTWPTARRCGGRSPTRTARAPGAGRPARRAPAAELAAERFEAVPHPKVRGAAVLSELTLDREPDFFHVCSSVSTLGGNQTRGPWHGEPGRTAGPPGRGLRHPVLRDPGMRGSPGSQRANQRWGTGAVFS
ncbi:KR domain-containing protein [Streptomyces kanasensis]|uniref:KR domain-containing protein n=1 Tax=Streptomyces kanasensis TaxID=936756 RepID=UPI0038262F17